MLVGLECCSLLLALSFCTFVTLTMSYTVANRPGRGPRFTATIRTWMYLLTNSRQMLESPLYWSLSPVVGLYNPCDVDFQRNRPVCSSKIYLSVLQIFLPPFIPNLRTLSDHPLHVSLSENSSHQVFSCTSTFHQAHQLSRPQLPSAISSHAPSPRSLIHRKLA